MNLFDSIKNVSEEQWHTKFKILKDAPFGEGERNILQRWAEGLRDRDHKMVQEFQKTFHASFWEFYLYACFKEAGFTLEQSHNRPDFMIKAPCELNVEAVVANIKNQEDYFQLQCEAIVRQSNALTSKIKKYNNEYSKCKWVKKMCLL